ncbi:MAG: N-acetylmuramoyl-L-alanine amidase [Flavobacteriales bacterium]|jgi:N-acetylmuramoyl-L-alanine amidase|tara:strand:- start:1620 stop:2747 length:1128 start_codon:yes stop_codon:yes gene_type:complete
MVKRFITIFLVLYSIPVCSYLFSANYDVALKKVIIDAGHGGKDPGNLGTGRYKLKEKDIALDVALKVGAYIKENMPEVEVIYTRDKDVFPELYERTALANNEKADLFISIHCDAFTSPDAVGCSSFVVGVNHGKHSRVAIKENPVIATEEDKLNYGNFDIKSPEYQIEVSLYQKMYEKNSLLLADKIQTQFRERVNRRDRGVKREPLYVTSRVAMPSVLVELGFLTNPKEEDFLNSEQGKTYMASAIYRAFKEYKSEQEGVIKDVKEVHDIVNGKKEIEVFESRDVYSSTLETYLAVQVFSATSIVSDSKLKDLEQPFYLQDKSGYKYCSGNFSNLEAVKTHQKALVNQGFKDCFIVGVHNNAKVSVSEVIELLK